MIRWVPLAGTALLLLACAHRGDMPDDGLGFAQRQARLSAIADWELDGTLIVDDGERRDRVQITWEQRGERISLTVRPTAFGIASFRISGDRTSLLIEGRGDTEVLNDPEADLYRKVGWWVPVTSLKAWLLGQPDAEYRSQLDRGPAGTVASLTQREWRIRYDEYQLAGDLLLPRAITLTYGELELSLSRMDWEPAGGA